MVTHVGVSGIISTYTKDLKSNIHIGILYLLVLGATTQSYLAFGQSRSIDSLVEILQETDDAADRIDILRRLAWSSIRTDISMARQYADEIIELAQTAKDTFHIALGTYYLGVIKRQESQCTQAIELLLRSLKLYQSVSADDYSRSGPLFNLAACHEAIGDYEKAITYLLEELEINKRLDLKKSVANSLNTLGTINKKLRNYEVAKDYLTQSASIAEQAKDTISLSIAWHNMAGVFFETNELDSALYFINRSLTLNTKIDDLIGLIYDHERRAAILAALKEYDRAKSDVLRSIDFSNIVGERKARLAAQQILAEIEFALGNYSRSLEICDSIFSDPIARLPPQSALALHKLRWQIFQHQEQWIKAGLAMQDILNLQDSSYNAKVAETVQNLEARYRLMEKEIQIDNLMENNELKNLALERSKKIRTLLGVGLILAISVLVFLVRLLNLRSLARRLTAERDQQKIIQLQQQNRLLAVSSMLEGQEQERSRIAQDLHDGLGALMATIKTHFNKISDEITALTELNIYEKTKTLIAEAGDEVRRISHDMMPASLKLLGLSAAVKDLGERVSNHQLDVAVEVIGAEFAMSKNATIMIYRIIQELVHNAIRHAQASYLLIQLMHTSDGISITVEDDGIGFKLSQRRPGLGLQSVKSRVNYLGGEMQVVSKKGEGTFFQIDIPYDSNQHEVQEERGELF